jgi:hypothetical protein
MAQSAQLNNVLSEDDKILLFEIYGLSQREYTLTLAEGGKADFGNYLIIPQGSNLETAYIDKTAVKVLIRSIQEINKNPAQVARVQEIIGEYKCISLDASTIEKDGYKFSPQNNMSKIHQALYPLTGLLIKRRYSNRINRG